MNPKGARYFGFNFLMPNPTTVDFCPGAACRTMSDFLKCTAAATAFLRASMKLKAAADLNKFPRTVDGLNKFFEHPGGDGVFLASLFADHYNHKTPKPITTVPTIKVAGVGSGAGKVQGKGGAGVGVQVRA
ncbi:hypothetical protein MYCTH_2305949 [Thermothelomyces thermophilus ATCC 42464]|uniref:Uncharacterized protein n=1 Tax=Thermothelomyces thermophilus (strain ATCC 42464 / BCRC 31852 / DSM 1799) TaxID=573729 RepID=G2QGC2_THET4|nr:uncharacterized protein MYCTH_2305949 [Thermothelomyces thermophilus ATCC 42464]AEO58536.1 hypothetical protein MYCTH_2305949 [Thermothelomyces thermophilus ATCC 42464]